MYKLKIVQISNNKIIAASELTEEQIVSAFNSKFNPLRRWINTLTGIGERKGRKYKFLFNDEPFIFEGGKLGKNLEKVLMLWLIENNPEKGFFADVITDTAKGLINELPLDVDTFKLSDSADKVADGSLSVKGINSNAEKLIDLSEEESENEQKD